MEWCPSCQAYRNVHVTTSTREATGEQGKTVQITTHTSHCETCQTTLHSEDVEQPTEDDLGESGQEEQVEGRD
jgi:hypothetical protein